MHAWAATGPQFQAIELHELTKPLVLQGLAYWRSLRGDRAYPCRDQISPRAIIRLLTNTVLLRVLDGGADFEFLVVGDEVTRAYRAPMLRRRLSEIAADLPNASSYWGGVYRDIVRTGKPHAVRFTADAGGEAKFSDAEAVLLPLGPTDEVVDHIITFTKRTIPRD
jgi:hypothetical protein